MYSNIRKYTDIQKYSNLKINMEKIEFDQIKRCSTTFLLALNDTMNVINGKWKIHVMGSLMFGKKRFKEIERDIKGITPRMLSKELKDLEMNGMITRTVYNTIPVTVEYELTQSGNEFQHVMDTMVQWGINHRKNTLGEASMELFSETLKNDAVMEI